MNRIEKKSGVYITGVSMLPVVKHTENSLRQMGALAIREAMADAGTEQVDALYLGNMLSGMLSHQQQLAPIVAHEADLYGLEAVTLEAACGSGGAALRNGFMAVQSGLCESVVVCGVEKMSHDDKAMITASIATASDWEIEGGVGETFVTLNARLMDMYLKRYNLPDDALAPFGINAHRNACLNPKALFHKEISLEDYRNSKQIAGCLRIFDASPICDGSAALVLSRYPVPGKPAIKIIASSAASEHVGINHRIDPLRVEGIRRSGQRALQMADIQIKDIDFFELHDAYSIIATLSLEGMGFAEEGKGWTLGQSGAIFREGTLPISSMGGLKARGHPIGASGVYQAVESYMQLTQMAGSAQLPGDLQIGLIQSIGGTASTIITHILQREN